MPDDQRLVALGNDVWRVKDACEGVIVFGATGSGKTSGSGQALARTYLAAGFGGLVLCAKPDESALWTEYAAKTGRASDLVLFGRDPKESFNFLLHESRRQGAGANLTENTVNVFTEIASIGIGSTAGGGADPFWERAMKSLVRNCIDLLSASGVPITLHNMFDVVRSDATTNEYASKLIGKEVKRFGSASRSMGSSPNSWLPTFSRSSGYSEQLDDIIHANEFSRLQKGGPENRYQVGAVIVQMGRTFGPNRQSWCVVHFNQRPGGTLQAEPPILGAHRAKQLQDLGPLRRLLFPWRHYKGRVGAQRWTAFALIWASIVAFALLLIMIAYGAPWGTNGAVEHVTAPASKAEGGREKVATTSGDTIRASALATTAKSAALPPIPVEVKFLNDEFGPSSKAIFTSSSPEILAVTVRVISHPSARIRDFHFRLSTVMSEAISGGPDKELLADGDEIEVTAPGFLPLKTTFHRSTKH